LAQELIHIAASEAMVLSKEQQRFNEAIREIEALRQVIAAQREAHTWLTALFFLYVQPTLQAYNQAFEGHVRALYQRLSSEKLQQSQRRRFTEYVQERVRYAVEQLGIASLWEIYNALLPEKEEEENALQEVDAQEEEPSHVHEEGDTAAKRGFEQKAKSAKRLAREARAKVTEQSLSQGIKKIYRGLAMLVHPDKATDEADAAYRHSLMQEVNAAYAAQNLLRLLELQAALLQRDESTLSALPADTLRAYNILLKRQIKELTAEAKDTNPTVSHPYGAYYRQTRAYTEMAMKAAAKESQKSADALLEHTRYLAYDAAFKQFLRGL